MQKYTMEQRLEEHKLAYNEGGILTLDTLRKVVQVQLILKFALFCLLKR